MALNLDTLRYGKKAEEIDPTQCPKDIDRLTFFHPTIPSEVRAMVPLLHSITNLEELADRIVNDWIDRESDIVSPKKEADNLVILYAKSLGGAVTPETLSIILTGFFSILRYVLKNKFVIKTVGEDLLKMNVPKAFVNSIVNRLREKRKGLELKIYENRLGFPNLSKLRWRVDVIISTGSLSRVMKPNITFQMTLSNGNVKTFELSVEQFNQLRHGVAKVLQDMQMLERHPIIKIVNEFEKKNELERRK